MTSLPNPHPFDNLIRSTHELHARFGTAQSIPLALRIADEEWREVQDEVFAIDADYEGGGITDSRLPALAHETADLIVTLIGLCNICGVTDEQLFNAMNEVATKNDSKTHETHEINPISRKIQRKVQS